MSPQAQEETANNQKLPLGELSTTHCSCQCPAGPTLLAPGMLLIGQCWVRGSERRGRSAARLANWMPLISFIVLYLKMFREEPVAWPPSRTHVQNFEHIKKLS